MPRRDRDNHPRRTGTWAGVAIALALVMAYVLVRQNGVGAAGGDWPQFGRDPQRTNATTEEVGPPYCYAWKWYGPPMPSRAQPVVSAGRLAIGDMDGVLHVRDAATGAPLWLARTDGPIRHSPAFAGDLVVTGSHDGFTHAFRTTDGQRVWRAATGPSATAPLADEARGRLYVASTSGQVTALTTATGAVLWQRQLGAPILLSPALSADGTLVIVGTEDLVVVALDAASGAERWRSAVQGQSLPDGAPVVAGSTVFVRSQPVHNFTMLLHEGDAVLDRAGPVRPDWAADWAAVRPHIVSYLAADPTKQTFFALDAGTGASRGVVPILYTHGNNDAPAMPAVRGTEVYVPFRPRHGIQTDGGSVHVTTAYDAELGRLDLGSLDLVALRQRNYPQYAAEFRLTSDEPAQVTLGGDWLIVDNWERIGAVNVRTGELAHLGAVSNDWPECWVQCGPGTDRPFFPMSGSGPAYPFPSPRVTEGHQRPGAVVAHGRVFWRVIEAGLAAFARRAGGGCPPAIVHGPASTALRPPANLRVVQAASASSTSLADYVWTVPPLPAVDEGDPLVTRLRQEVADLVSLPDHPLPFFFQRGFSNPAVWPRETPNPPGPPAIALGVTGNVVWHDPGELLGTLAGAYPYLDGPLRARVRTFVARELGRYPPLENLPWHGLPWLRQGSPRERYDVPFRDQLGSWPPPGASLAAIHAVWSWAHVTGDRDFAAAQWRAAQTLFRARRTTMTAYADIAGAIGYARLARWLGETAAAAEGEQAAVAAMTAGRDFAAWLERADRLYLDPRDEPTGWSLPVFFGMTPEVGRYLREQVGAPALRVIEARQGGNGVRWWYLTRAGAHAEIGETSFLSPMTAWSHFLAQAYVVGAPRGQLERWLDRPWTRGDVYSIQKVVATLAAPR